MYDKLDEIERRYDELQQKIGDPSDRHGREGFPRHDEVDRRDPAKSWPSTAS